MGTGVKAGEARADMSSTTSRYSRNQQRPQLSRVQAQLFVFRLSHSHPTAFTTPPTLPSPSRPCSARLRRTPHGQH